VVQIIIGITGSIASGKTTASNHLEKTLNDVFTLNVDEIAKDIYSRDKEVLEDLRSCFGSNVFCQDGTIDYRVLGSIVFSSKKDLKKLNNLMFLKIKKRILEILAKNKNKKNIIIDAAILFDAKLDELCDIVILVRAPDNIREKNLKLKSGLSSEEIKLRLRGQHLTINNNCINFIIDNKSGKSSLYKKIEQVAEKIKSINKVATS